jgi:hypothetical protein
MPQWLKSLLDLVSRALDRLGDASERFMALLCLALVVPLALIADTALILWGQQGRDRLKDYVDYDAIIGPYLMGVFAVAIVLAACSELGAPRLAALLDRMMMPIAYTASGLLVLFAILMWATGGV